MMSIEDVLNNQTAWYIECGNAIEVMQSMPANSVHLCVTSPPYYGLRAYSKEASTNELGREKAPDCGLNTTPAWVREKYGLETCGECYVCRLVAVCNEVKRVLRDDGVFFLNLGDSFSRSGGDGTSDKHKDGMTRQKGRKDALLGEKNLLGIPWRVALALQASGWILRCDCVWTKLAAMPSSVQGWRWERCRVKVGKGQRSREKKAVTTSGRPHGGRHDNGKDFDSLADRSDCPGCSKCEATNGFILRRGSWRPTTAHEYIFMFAKSQRYYADGYAVRQRLAEATIMRDRYTRVLDDPDEQFAVAHDHETVSNPDDGANLRSWLVLPGENFSGKHYAVFPPSLPALAIKCGTSEAGVCPHCGAPHARMVQKKSMVVREGPKANGTMTEPPSVTTLGWRQTCTCPEHTPIGAVVLDQFAGASTTIVAARRLGRRAIGIELYEENCRLGGERVQSDNPLFNVP